VAPVRVRARAQVQVTEQALAPVPGQVRVRVKAMVKAQETALAESPACPDRTLSDLRVPSWRRIRTATRVLR
jgi:phytoene/squalene synthetase